MVHFLPNFYLKKVGNYNAIQIVCFSVSGFCDAFHTIINFITKTSSKDFHFLLQKGEPPLGKLKDFEAKQTIDTTTLKPKSNYCRIYVILLKLMTVPV